MRTRTAPVRHRVRPRPSLRFRHERAAGIAREYGATDLQSQAVFFGGMHRTTYSRVVSGDSNPGADFIAAVLTAKPEDPRISFDNLFEVVWEAGE